MKRYYDEEPIRLLPALDLDRAENFYSEKLGLNLVEVTDDEVSYRVGETQFSLFPSTGRPSGEHTQLGSRLTTSRVALVPYGTKGVVFEEYDLPGFKSVDGIVELEGERVLVRGFRRQLARYCL